MPVEDGLEFKSPMLQFINKSRFLFRPAATEWPEERDRDVFFYNTQYIDGTEDIELPRGYVVKDPPASDEVDETYAYFKCHSQMSDGKLQIIEDGKIKRRQIPPDGYEGLKTAMDEAEDFAGTVFRAEKGGEK